MPMQIRMMIPAVAALLTCAGCSAADNIEHTHAAECSRLSGKYVAAPSNFGGGAQRGSFFLSDNAASQRADNAREAALKSGCIQQ